MFSLFAVMILLVDCIPEPSHAPPDYDAGFEPFQLPVEITLISPPSGQLYIEDLWRIYMFNGTAETFNAYLFASIEREGDGLLMEATTSVFRLPPGSLILGSAELSPIDAVFFNSEFQTAVERMGEFPDGFYIVTISAYEEGGILIGETGFGQNVENHSPPVLIYPYNDSEVPEPLPVFSWFPSLPQGTTEYTLRIVELIEGQSPQSAISANPAWFTEESLVMEELPYPVYADAFENGHEYAWQVEAAFGAVSVGMSEVWTFTFNTSLDGSEEGGSELWSFETGGEVICSPAIAPDGSIICGSSDGFIYSLDQEGYELWRYSAGGVVYSTVIGPYGNIYSAGESGICCLDPTGSVLWRNRDLGLVETCPVIIPEGVLFSGTTEGIFYMIDSENGDVIDSLVTDGKITLPAVIDSTGAIYASSDDGWIYSLEAEAGLIQNWSFRTDNTPAGGPVIFADCLFTANGRFVCCFNRSGEQIWESALPSEVLSGPVVSANGTLYAGTIAGNINILETETGRRCGVIPAGGAILSTPALNASGTLFFGSDDGLLYCYSPEGFGIWEFETGGAIRSSPVIGMDGTIYFGSNDHRIYAVTGPGAGPMTGGWPEYCLNSFNNGYIPDREGAE